MQTNDLTGTLVLVHPELADDPAYRQGEIGKIFKADVLNDNIIVDFGDDCPALYAADALLVLKDKEALFYLVEHGIDKLTEPERMGIRGIALIVRYGFEDSALMGIKLCRENPGIRNYAMESLQDLLDRQPNLNIGR